MKDAMSTFHFITVVINNSDFINCDKLEVIAERQLLKQD